MEKPGVAHFLIYSTNTACFCISKQHQLIAVGERRFGSVNYCVDGEVSDLIFLRCD